MPTPVYTHKKNEWVLIPKNYEKLLLQTELFDERRCSASCPCPPNTSNECGGRPPSAKGRGGCACLCCASSNATASSSMRLLKTAIWTSGEPVSLSCIADSLIILPFFCLVSIGHMVAQARTFCKSHILYIKKVPCPALSCAGQDFLTRSVVFMARVVMCHSRSSAPVVSVAGGHAYFMMLDIFFAIARPHMPRITTAIRPADVEVCAVTSIHW